MSFCAHTSSSPPSSRERLWDNTQQSRLWLAWVLICLIIALVWLSWKLCQIFPHLCAATAHGRRSPTQPTGFVSLFNSLFSPPHIFKPILLELHLSTPSVICFTNYQLKLFLRTPKPTEWSLCTDHICTEKCVTCTPKIGSLKSSESSKQIETERKTCLKQNT